MFTGDETREPGAIAVVSLTMLLMTFAVIGAAYALPRSSLPLPEHSV